MSIKQYPGGIVTKNPTAPTTSAAKGIWTLDQVSNYVKQGIWPRIPGAPTIGTATAVTSSTATVTFTAPTDLGAGAITYTATSSPGSLTGTGTSPITVAGLTASTSYTFTVRASTPGGTGPSSAASNSVTPVLAIGDAYEGGFYSGQISTAGTGVADYNLVVAPKASGQSSLTWRTPAADTPGTSSGINGPANSAAMNNASHPAAQFCEGLSIGGYSDWYMPAFYELEVCYYFLKPTTTNNNTAVGSNSYAVSPEPISTPYTSGSPAQTSATIFRSGNAEAFDPNYYWGSTQTGLYNRYAFVRYFNNGTEFNYGKANARRVRAVRRVAV